MQNMEQTTSDDQRLGLADEIKLIANSNMFDSAFYRATAELTSEIDAIEHYLRYGWRRGLEPSAHLEIGWLYPYFDSAGFNSAPALTYTTLQRAGAPVYATREAAERVAKLVRESGLFDAGSYAARVGNIAGLDPALHYVIIGERLGYAPSPGFDPIYYMKRYPDVGQAPECLLAHYCEYGKKRGRRALSVASGLTFDRSRLDPDRDTILIVSHQASRTGAPILAYNIVKRLRSRYNVVTLVLLGGELFPDFEAYSNAVIGPVTTEVEFNYVEAEYIAKRLKESYPIKYAIVNSIDSRTMLKPLMCALIPTVTLVHEFAIDLRTRGQAPGEMGRWLEWTNQIVFPAEIVAESVRAEYPHLVERPVHILPQGPLELPARGNSTTQQQQQGDALRLAMRPLGTEQHTVVLGCGTIFARKGVDLFFECAARVAALKTKQCVRFIWIGRRLPDAIDRNFFVNLTDWIKRASIADRAIILDEVTDLDPAYASADIFFLSSQLDPMPNVAVDSALRGTPVVCFDKTGGIAGLLAADEGTRACVVPHLDVKAAANIIARLADDEGRRAEIGRSIQRVAKTIFDMDRYVDRLDHLGREAERMTRQFCEDFETIKRDPDFDMFMFLEPHAIETTRDELIRLFLARAGALSTSTQQTANFYFRRPCIGFHPQIYVHENACHYDAKIVNPLAHFIRAGKPDGPWRHDVITPANRDAKLVWAKSLNAAVHGHFFYPELITDFVEKLAVNETRCDLLLSTNDKRKAKRLRAATHGYDRGEVVIRVVPNRGRDIGALLTGFPGEIANYDVIGHFHGKRSFHLRDRAVGDKWREFLWQNLLGGLHPMMNAVLDRFATDDSIGLVFADEPHLSDWDFNRQISEDLAKRMGWSQPLPPYFDFPIGTMFWARPRALEPLLRTQFAMARLSGRAVSDRRHRAARDRATTSFRSPSSRIPLCDNLCSRYDLVACG